jgi:HAD superfamily hydrolase (TIGR01509 family)
VIHAILFDFDGLILDTETPIFTAWQRTYEDHGCSLTVEEYALCLGSNHDVFNPYEDLERKAGRALPWEELRPRISECYSALIQEKDALPGVRECLAQARDLGLRIGLASSSTREWVTAHLTRLELLSYFDAFRTRDDVSRIKPQPDLFLAGLEALGADAGRTFVLEDSPNGILAAKRAGIFVVAVPNTLTRDLHLNDPDLRVNSLADTPLPDLLEKIAEQKRCCL